MATRLRPVLAILALLGLAAAARADAPGPPPGSVIEPAGDRFPAQRLRSEVAGGRQSTLVALGNTAFSSPLLFGGPARAAGLSCNACHVNGHLNANLFIPGHSARPGGLDTTGPLFNPAADNGVADPVDIPSLRGVRFLAPYGRDGRIASLREFTRQVIVGEFAGAEPSPLILDALVAYMNEFEFLPNDRLTPLGALVPDATEAERRGEARFRAAGGATPACATCHTPATAFADGRTYDVGTGGRFRTPTLLNSASSAPYGHDGRWPDFPAAVAGHAWALGLALSDADRADLVAYLGAVGAANEAEEPATFRREMAEVATYVSLLDDTAARGDAALTRFVVDTTLIELDRAARAFPTGDADRQSGRPDRRKPPPDFPALAAGLRAVAEATEAGHPEAALDALDAYRDLAERSVANYPRPPGARRRPTG